MRNSKWVRLLAYVTGSVNQELLLQNEYLAAENRILRTKLPARLRLSDPERVTLAEIGKRVGRKALQEIACIAKPDTILTWYRRLIAQKFDGWVPLIIYTLTEASTSRLVMSPVGIPLASSFRDINTPLAQAERAAGREWPARILADKHRRKEFAKDVVHDLEKLLSPHKSKFSLKTKLKGDPVSRIVTGMIQGCQEVAHKLRMKYYPLKWTEGIKDREQILGKAIP